MNTDSKNNALSFKNKILTRFLDWVLMTSDMPSFLNPYVSRKPTMIEETKPIQQRPTPKVVKTKNFILSWG